MHAAHGHFKNIHGGFFDRHPHLVQFLGDLLYVFLLLFVSMVLAVLANDKLDSKLHPADVEQISEIDADALKDLHIL